MSLQKKNNLGIVFAGLLLGILMASMDNTIVTTAMGTIIGDLGGLDKFVWVSSAYLISEMAGMPIFGKLSDMYGRKIFFIFGILVFMLGSILCGTAQTMIQLSIYRAIQGISGGAIIPIAFTIMYDVVPSNSRGKLGGLFGAVFGIASIFGPLLGAFITDHINWHWVFYINLPIGFLALIFVAFFYKESHEHSKQKIDWLGAFTLVGAIVCLMFALELGGRQLAWNSALIISLFGGFALMTVLFLIAEVRAAEPIISFDMFRKRLYAMSNATAIFGGAAFVITSVYTPIFIQGVLGGSATNSGLVLLPMMLGTVVTATIGGFLMQKFSYRAIMIPASVMFAVGIYLLTTLSSSSSQLIVTMYMIIVGLGIGFSFSVLGNASIHSFDANQRGSASSTLTFLRSLGMTIGITIFGIIQSHTFMNKLASDAHVKDQLPQGMANNSLLDPAMRVQIPSSILDKITEALSSSIVLTFGWALVPAILALLTATAMSNEKLETDPDSKSKAEASAIVH
ncbi:MDR family MFS transporter [Paenibacillus aceris]|uniref:EmrB/QacA subfamily drug resistance transporter n=2 Tax=Paenibacillus aceris TaxID=869555 RepID=A0ABS4I515_9BACL|nr:MDR family MFS transporter [Paenibacillus aceris]MBP1965621.1 EmrB/QacA subfamily drug resistance transporter [Paenibacillus aceris]